MIGPGFAAIIGLFMVTSVFRNSGGPPLEVVLGLSHIGFLVQGVVAYLVAAAIAFPLGFWLGARSPSAVILPAIGIMFLGVLLLAFASGGAMLLIARVLSGLGAGAALGVTAGLIRRLEAGRVIAAAVVAGIGVVALVVAPFISGAIADAFSFRIAHLATIFFLFLALLASAAGAIALSMRARRSAQPGGYVMQYPPQPYPAQQYPAQGYPAAQQPPTPQYQPQQPPPAQYPQQPTPQYQPQQSPPPQHPQQPTPQYPPPPQYQAQPPEPQQPPGPAH